MISVVFTVEGQIGASVYPNNFKGKILARERFNELTAMLQNKDQITEPIDGDKLSMFINGFGSVQLVNPTPTRPWFKINRIVQSPPQAISLAYGRLVGLLGDRIEAELGVMTERKKKSYTTAAIHKLHDLIFKKKITIKELI